MRHRPFSCTDPACHPAILLGIAQCLRKATVPNTQPWRDTETDTQSGNRQCQQRLRSTTSGTPKVADCRTQRLSSPSHTLTKIKQTPAHHSGINVVKFRHSSKCYGYSTIAKWNDPAPHPAACILQPVLCTVAFIEPRFTAS